MMHIDEPETLRSQYRQASDKRDWIIKNAECLACTPYDLATWLINQGEKVERAGWLPGNPAYIKPHKYKARDKAEPDTEPEPRIVVDNAITLMITEAGIIRQYVDKYRETCEEGYDDEIMTAADRLATALDVILTIAAARNDV